MIEVSNVSVFNIDNAMRGMRNPKNSWHKNDTVDGIIGPNDMKLATALVKAGEPHCKFLRQIFVSMDINAPLYWWKEMDTYKVGTTTNSTSTMHKLSDTPITRDCFSIDNDTFHEYGDYASIKNMIDYLEKLRIKYLETGDMGYWVALIQLLPESWNQKRTWTADYAVLRNIYTWRKNHKLVEWRDFCGEIEKLPNSELITLKGE